MLAAEELEEAGAWLVGAGKTSVLRILSTASSGLEQPTTCLQFREGIRRLAGHLAAGGCPGTEAERLAIAERVARACQHRRAASADLRSRFSGLDGDPPPDAARPGDAAAAPRPSRKQEDSDRVDALGRCVTMQYGGHAPSVHNTPPAGDVLIWYDALTSQPARLAAVDKLRLSFDAAGASAGGDVRYSAAKKFTHKKGDADVELDKLGRYYLGGIYGGAYAAPDGCDVGRGDVGSNVIVQDGELQGRAAPGEAGTVLFANAQVVKNEIEDVKASVKRLRLTGGQVRAFATALQTAVADELNSGDRTFTMAFVDAARRHLELTFASTAPRTEGRGSDHDASDSSDSGSDSEEEPARKRAKRPASGGKKSSRKGGKGRTKPAGDSPPEVLKGICFGFLRKELDLRGQKCTKAKGKCNFEHKVNSDIKRAAKKYLA